MDPRFLDFDTNWSNWLASRPCRFMAEESVLRSHWIGDFVCPRATLGNIKKRKFLALSGLKFSAV
jgi:hypothetical protein